MKIKKIKEKNTIKNLSFAIGIFIVIILTGLGIYTTIKNENIPIDNKGEFFKSEKKADKETIKYESLRNYKYIIENSISIDEKILVIEIVIDEYQDLKIGDIKDKEIKTFIRNLRNGYYHNMINTQLNDIDNGER